MLRHADVVIIIYLLSHCQWVDNAINVKKRWVVSEKMKTYYVPHPNVEEQHHITNQFEIRGFNQLQLNQPICSDIDGLEIVSNQPNRALGQ